MESYYNICGIIFLLIGVFIHYQIGKRRFNRRSFAGLQIYSNYLRGLITTTVETLLNLLGILFMVLGLIAIIIGY